MDGEAGRAPGWLEGGQEHEGDDGSVILPQNYAGLEAMSFSFMHLLSEGWHVVLCVEIKKMTWGSLLSSLAWCVTQYFVYLWEHSFSAAPQRLCWRERGRHEEGEGWPSPPQRERNEKIKPGTQAAAD